MIKQQGEFYKSSPYAQDIVAATKWCVFKPIEPTTAIVFSAVRERMERMKTHRVDLLQVISPILLGWFLNPNNVQFHWQDYSDRRYITALRHLADLKDQGFISVIGLCNFDTIRTDEICTQLGPGAVASNQVQVTFLFYSFLRSFLTASWTVFTRRHSAATWNGWRLSETWAQAAYLWHIGWRCHRLRTSISEIVLI